MSFIIAAIFALAIHEQRSYYDEYAAPQAYVCYAECA